MSKFRYEDDPYTQKRITHLSPDDEPDPEPTPEPTPQPADPPEGPGGA